MYIVSYEIKTVENNSFTLCVNLHMNWYVSSYIVTYELVAPVAWGRGVSIQPMPSLRRQVRGDYLAVKSYPLPPALCMQGLLECNGAYELG